MTLKVLSRLTVLIAALSLLAACGGNNGNDTAVCTQTGNMTLSTSSSGTMLLTSITVTVPQNASVPPVPVWVRYVTPPVGAILAGYPADGVDPSSFGIDVVQAGTNTDNPLEFQVTFDAYRSPATYQAVLRFVAANQNFTAAVGCQDVPVTFTVN
jgi:hypothetical protein